MPVVRSCTFAKPCACKYAQGKEGQSGPASTSSPPSKDIQRASFLPPRSFYISVYRSRALGINVCESSFSTQAFASLKYYSEHESVMFKQERRGMKFKRLNSPSCQATLRPALRHLLESGTPDAPPKSSRPFLLSLFFRPSRQSHWLSLSA